MSLSRINKEKKNESTYLNVYLYMTIPKVKLSSMMTFQMNSIMPIYSFFFYEPLCLYIKYKEVENKQYFIN